jgi:hypothetical protein
MPLKKKRLNDVSDHWRGLLPYSTDKHSQNERVYHGVENKAQKKVTALNAEVGRGINSSMRLENTKSNKR